MFPIILRIGPLNLYTYGLMLFISFLVGIKIVEHRAKRFGVEAKKVQDLALIVLITVILGSRLLYVILHLDEFKNDWIGTIAFWRGGLAGLMFFGGLIPAIIAGIFYVRHQKIPLLKMFDAIAPALVLGEFFTRIGCFANGCCFGKPTTFFLGIKFPDESVAGSTFAVPIHPTQLYSSLAGLLLFFLALFLEKRRLKSGLLFFIIFGLYSAYRFLVDFLRFYEDSANFWVNQIIALSLVVVSIFMVIYLSYKNPKSKLLSGMPLVL